jgi:hypothetical protein
VGDYLDDESLYFVLDEYITRLWHEGQEEQLVELQLVKHVVGRAGVLLEPADIKGRSKEVEL